LVQLPMSDKLVHQLKQGKLRFELAVSFFLCRPIVRV
jgi:hypothetical protein